MTVRGKTILIPADCIDPFSLSALCESLGRPVDSCDNLVVLTFATDESVQRAVDWLTAREICHIIPFFGDHGECLF